MQSSSCPSVWCSGTLPNRYLRNCHGFSLSCRVLRWGVFKESREDWGILRIHREDWGTLVESPPTPPFKKSYYCPKVKINWKKTFQPKTRFQNGDVRSRFDLTCRAACLLCWQGSNGDKACDYYHRWKDDIARISEYGFNTYRCLGWNWELSRWF